MSICTRHQIQHCSDSSLKIDEYFSVVRYCCLRRVTLWESCYVGCYQYGFFCSLTKILLSVFIQVKEESQDSVSGEFRFKFHIFNSYFVSCLDYFLWTSHLCCLSLTHAVTKLFACFVGRDAK